MRDATDAAHALANRLRVEQLGGLAWLPLAVPLAAGRTLVMFVDEHPSIGPAGALLTKIIQALGLQRDQVSIANVTHDLEAQIRLIHPRVICALGQTAANALLQLDTPPNGTGQAPLSTLRGGTYEVQGIPVIVTYHPAHLLRHPEAKRDCWADVQRLLPYIRGATNDT